jgi:cellulose synthase/poly-beta-1,6-N-acetylglucosamine synthase-like glycosyltransferase
VTSLPVLFQLLDPLYLICIFFLLSYAARYYVFTPTALRWSIDLRRDVSLDPNIDPFVSILLPLYNEPNVVERLLASCTSIDYPNYEVIVIDDSTDDTTVKLEKWKGNPKVKVIHRSTREGWKGGALNVGLANLHPRSTHVIVFDADFVPPPDIVVRFLKHFENPDVNAVQGYQKHDLNETENMITRAVRVFRSTAYKVDLEARSKLGMFPIITGSVFMIRTDVLKRFGFEHDITEDYNLSLRLYLSGYSVLYDCSLEVSGECPSTLGRVVRQVGRWAEGTTRNTKQYFWRILRSEKLSWRQKLDFLMFGFSYLNAVVLLFAMVFGWASLYAIQHNLISPMIKTAIIFPLLGIPAVPLAEAIGLYKDGEGLRKVAIIPVVLLLSYILLPVSAYYSLKGLARKGTMFQRTYKTGRVMKECIF